MPTKRKPCIDCGNKTTTLRCAPCYNIFKRKPPEQRFWAKVDKDGPIVPGMTTPCWVWTGAKGKQGYGHLLFSAQKIKKAHRVSYEIHFGIIDPKKDICHHCDNPSCVRPDHLFEGTTRDNILDMERKGRAYHPRGNNSGQAKLTESDVINIRKLYKQDGMTYKKLASMYQIGKTTISHIIKYRTWTHLP